MRLLVFSDSHSGLSFMRRCCEALHPDGILHLGDHYDDGEVIRDAFPQANIWMVPGNCDRYRAPIHAQEILTPIIGGVSFYLTHGHLHRVKSTLFALLRDARAAGAQVVLFGHTHQAYLNREEEDGLLVMNPGSCGYYGGSAGLIEIENGAVTCFRLLRERDLEELQ